MSIFDPNSNEYKEQQRSQQMREEAQALIESETQFFFARAMKGIDNPSPEMEAFGENLTREMLTIVRGIKQRTEQIGENSMRMATVAHQAWDATQVTIDAVAKQSIKANAAARELKNVMATREDSNLRYVASAINPQDFGWRDLKGVNDAFESSSKALVRMAKEAAARGEGQTAETQADAALKYIMTEHAQELSELPGVQNAMQLRTVPDLVDIVDGDNNGQT